MQDLKKIQFVLAVILLPTFALAQTTTSSMGGSVKTNTGEPLVGATVTVIHEPSGTIYRVQSRSAGRFDVSNLNPGGPYSVEVSFINFTNEKNTDIYLTLGDSYKVDFALAPKASNLGNVVVTGLRKTIETSGKGSAETTIGRDKMANLPTVGRNLQDYLRYVPQAKLVGTNGNVAGISIAGQNNRYNSLFVDGAVNNDIFGLSVTGTNGGQAGVGPISIDAIDQLQVAISPFDASVGNFTGGAINATTRSGTNKTEGSVYYFLQNENLAGKTPTGPKSDATKFAPFLAKTYGFRVGGALIQNKLFCFINVVQIKNTRPQPFNYSTYRGALTQPGIEALSSYLKTTYNYDPGSFLDNPEKVAAERISVKFNWNVNDKTKFIFSYRYNKSERDNTVSSNSSTINFYNNGEYFPSITHSTSLELRTTYNRGTSNRLLITYTGVKDDRGTLGNPFPRVTINDIGSTTATIRFGTEELSTANFLAQKNIGLYDVFKINLGKHLLSFGTDNELSKSNNVFIRQNYGSYTFSSITDFYTAATVRPNRYQRSFSKLDNKSDDTEAAAKFNSLRLGLFVNDEIKVSSDFTLNLGLRADYTKFLTTPREDQFFNDTAITAISKYYDLKGARSGQISSPAISLSPRIGFAYKIPKETIVFRGGVGMFTGRVPLAWPGGVYNQNGVSLGGVDIAASASPTAIQPPLFNPNPFNQPDANTLGIKIEDQKGQIDLIAKDFKLNKLLRFSLAVDKNFGNGWSSTIEAIFNKNINEIYYENVNIIPPTIHLTGNGQDNRLIYTTDNSPARIPMRYNGTNPYQGNIFLLSNNKGKKGFSYNFTVGLTKTIPASRFSFNINYTYGNSFTAYEGTSSRNNSQWNNMINAYGKNFVSKSISDFSLGHRITAYVSKKFAYAKGTLGTTITLYYNGQSGEPMSYVYSNSLIRDVNNNNARDLIYIPTGGDLAAMTFVTSGGISPDAQKTALNTYIESDDYLRNHRGQYAERNGSRLPSQNIIDLSIKQDFNIKVGAKRYQFQLTYDVFNFGNMLNRSWGRTYFLGNFSSYGLITVNSFSGTTPRYTFNTSNVGRTPWALSTSSVPSFASRWISQIGLRFNF